MPAKLGTILQVMVVSIQCSPTNPMLIAENSLRGIFQSKAKHRCIVMNEMVLKQHFRLQPMT